VKNLLSLVFFVALVLNTFTLFAQEQHSSAAPEHAAQAQSQPDRSADATLVHESREAAGEEDPHAEFKQSSSVKFVARATGLSLQAAYWLLVIFNFLVIAGVIGWALRKNLPTAFRTRTDTIRKSMDEARKASEDANRRLGDIEGRLSRLDSEIAEMRRSAEADAVAEEARIRAAAEEDRRKVIEMTEQEIDAAARAARRDLKAYTADLAVSLAEKKINVDPKTDEALLHAFVQQLGRDGR
jgi:F-type H+-transporting ATPase subunit b